MMEPEDDNGASARITRTWLRPAGGGGMRRPSHFYVAYEIHVKWRGRSWSVLRRYNQFRQLHKELEEYLAEAFAKESGVQPAKKKGLFKRNKYRTPGNAQLPILPKRKLVGNTNDDFVEKRRQLLDTYLQEILEDEQFAQADPLLEFLQITEKVVTFFVGFFKSSDDGPEKSGLIEMDLFAKQLRLCNPRGTLIEAFPFESISKLVTRGEGFALRQVTLKIGSSAGSEQQRDLVLNAGSVEEANMLCELLEFACRTDVSDSAFNPFDAVPALRGHMATQQLLLSA